MIWSFRFPCVDQMIVFCPQLIVFYRDWWNASEVSAYWRLWNMPVHYWLVRHVYFPSVRLGLSKTAATFVVFLFSAILHEVLISVPCHMIRIHSFLAMMGQLPLIFLTKMIDRRFPSIGNVIFWILFCFVGQLMAMLFYTGRNLRRRIARLTARRCRAAAGGCDGRRGP